MEAIAKLLAGLNPVTAVLSTVFGATGSFLKAVFSNKYVWYAIAVVALGFTIVTASNKVVNNIREQIAHENKIDALEKKLADAEKAKKFAEDEKTKTQQAFDDFKLKQGNMDKKTDDSQKVIHERLKTGQLTNPVQSQVVIDTMTQLDQLSAGVQ